MSRSAVAFVVSPLWAPLAVGLWLGTARIQFMVPVAFVAYALTLVLGYPGFYYLRSQRMMSLLRLMGWGFVVGAVAWTLIAFCVALFQYDSIAMAFCASLKNIWSGPELLGVVIAATFWLIARPDRETGPTVRS
jgi:hypothetical protein